MEDQKYANFWDRFVAVMIDGFILMAVGWGIGNMFGINNFFEQMKLAVEQGENYVANPNSLRSLLTLAISVAYTVGFWVKHEGQTPGKRAMKIQVVKTNGEELDWFTAGVRYISQWVSTIPFFLGYLWVVFDKKKQGWHDKIARTYVVYKDKERGGKLTGIFVFIIMLLFISGMFGYGVYTAYTASRGETQSRRSVQENKEEMSEEVKAYYDRFRELFAQIKEAETKEETIKLNDENIEELKAAIELDENNAELWNSLGSAYTWWNSTGTLEAGLAAYQKALELVPENAFYAENVGMMLNKIGRHEDAVLSLKHALRLKENYASTHKELGFAYGRLKIKDDAKTHLNRAVELFSADNEDGRHDQEILTIQKWISQLEE